MDPHYKMNSNPDMRGGSVIARLGAVAVILVAATIASLATSGKIPLLRDSDTKTEGTSSVDYDLPKALEAKRYSDRHASLIPNYADAGRTVSMEASKWAWYPDEVLADLGSRVSSSEVAVPVEVDFLGEIVYVVSEVDALYLLNGGLANSVRLAGGKVMVVPSLHGLVLSGHREIIKRLLAALPPFSSWEGMPVDVLQRIYVSGDAAGAYSEVLRAFKRRGTELREQCTPAMIMATEYGLGDAVRQSYTRPAMMRDWALGHRHAHSLLERAKVLRLYYGSEAESRALLSELDTLFPHDRKTVSTPLLAYLGYRLQDDYWSNPMEAWMGLFGDANASQSLVAALSSGLVQVEFESLSPDRRENLVRTMLRSARYVAAAAWRSEGRSPAYYAAMSAARTYAAQLDPSDAYDWIGCAYDVALFEGDLAQATALLERAQACTQGTTTFRELEAVSRAWWQIAGDGHRAREVLLAARTRARIGAHVVAALDYLTQFRDVPNAVACLQAGERDAALTEQWCALAAAWRLTPDREADAARCIEQARLRVRNTEDLLHVATMELLLPDGKAAAAKSVQAAIETARAPQDLVRCASLMSRYSADEEPVRELLGRAVVRAERTSVNRAVQLVGIAHVYQQVLDDSDAARTCMTLAQDACHTAEEWYRVAAAYLDVLQDKESARDCLDQAESLAEGTELIRLAEGHAHWFDDPARATACLSRFADGATTTSDFIELFEAHLTLMGDWESAMHTLDRAENAARRSVERTEVANIRVLLGKEPQQRN